MADSTLKNLQDLVGKTSAEAISKLDNSPINPLTTPIANNLKGFNDIQRAATVQQQQARNPLGGLIGPGNISAAIPTSNWVSQSYTSVPVEVYNTRTGKTVKTYNNILDYQKDNLVVKGGATSSAQPGLGDYASMIPNVAIKAKQGQSLAGPLGAAVGASIGLVESARDMGVAYTNAYKAFATDPRRSMSLLAEETQDADGKTFYKLNWDKAAGSNSLSGAITKTYSTAPTDTPVSWDYTGTQLNIDVAPAFANSDTYKDYIAGISERLAGLTRATDDKGEIVKQLNTAISQLQDRYFIDAEEAANIKAMFPEASEEAITTAVNNTLTGYVTSESDLAAPLMTYTANGELVERSAEKVFNEIYDMGDDKIKKDQYLNRLISVTNDPSIDDSTKAIVQGELAAIYAINQNKHFKYKDMITKGWAEYLGENALLLGQSINDIASAVTGGNAYGELSAFADNTTIKTVTGLASTAVNTISTLYAMNKIEDAARSVGSKLGDWLGKASTSVFGADSGLTKLTEWFSEASINPGAFLNIETKTFSDMAGKWAAGALDFGYQAVADLTFDLAKLGFSQASGKEMDFWNEFSNDLAMDILFTYAHTGVMQDAMKQAGLADFSVADLSRIIRDNGRVEVDEATGTKTLKFSIETRGEFSVDVKTEEATGKGDNKTQVSGESEVKGLSNQEFADALSKTYYAVNNESQQRAAQFIVKINQNPIVNKVYSAVVDDHINMKMLGYQKLAATGDYTDLIKLSNASNYRQLLTEVNQDFATRIGRKASAALDKAVDNFGREVGHKKLTDAEATYLNASQAWSRVQQDYKKADTEYIRAEQFYKDALNGVDEPTRLALDELGVAISAYAKSIGAFEVDEGLQTSEFYKNIQKYNNYFPLFVKRDGKGGRAVEYSRTHRETKDGEVLIHPSAMENPVVSVMQYHDAVMRNATRARQVNAVLDVIKTVPGIKISEDSRIAQDFESLPLEKLVEKYNIPKEAQKTMRALADTETSYRKAVDTIIQKNLFQEKIDDYVKAQAMLAKSAENHEYRTIEGNPIMSKGYRGYKKGMTAEEMRGVFLDDIRDSVEGMLGDVRRHNYKFRKYFTNDPRSSLEIVMATIARQIDTISPESLMKIVTTEVTKVMPMVSYDQLVYNWVSNSAQRQEELLSDPDILSGKAGYDISKNRKVETGKPSIRLYTDGRVETLYLEGETKEDVETAKAVAEIFNAPLSQPTKNGLLKILKSTMQKTAQIKRNVLSGILPSRAPVNKVRDMGQAVRAVGGSAVVSPYALFSQLIDESAYTKTELKEIYTTLDRVATQAQGYTEFEIAKMYREGKLGGARQLANRPEAPGFEEQLQAKPAQRTLNQLEYQFRLLRYNASQGAVGEIIMTPGNLAEASTRATVGQNTVIAELTRRMGMGDSFEDALSAAYAKGTWASRNATTNFATKGWLTSKLAQYTPFSYSSFSDLASKVETWVMDPTGVSSRTFTSMLAYGLNLAALLANEDNRKRYMNLSEYDRTHSMSIATGFGGLLTIPMDEGFAGLLSPMRTFIETLAYQEPVTFWKVFGSVLDMGPVDLSGFTEGDTFNFTRGVEKLFDAYAPALLTTAAELTTGRDFYYGDKISVDDMDLAMYNRSADSAGDYVRNGKDSKTLHWLADFLHFPQWQVEQVFSLFTGKIGSYALHYLDKLQGATEENTYSADMLQSFYKSFVSSSNNIENEFYNGLEAFKEEKQKLQVKLNANWEAQQKATGDELSKLKIERQQMMDNFAVRVTDYIAKYVSAYEMTGGLSDSQASSIYYLFDFTPTIMGGGFDVGTAGSQAFEEAKSQSQLQAAVMQSQALGTNYNSRKIYQKADGTFERESPTGVQALNRLVFNRSNEYAAQLTRMAADSNLRKGKQQVQDQINAIYDKGTLTNEDYNQIETLQAAWDVQAALALAPFFQAYGTDMIKNSAVADVLDDYFIVIGDFARDKKGRRISSPNLNKQRGFGQAFVKNMYEKVGIK